MSYYYNENDPKAAAWLRELMRMGEIPEGVIDERSILEVKPYELTEFHQQHFFAGIGGWALALRLAGWPEDKPVRTGSCPCQPFSQSGKQLGTKDERHLWPVLRDLITFGDSTITFGEQVASPLGREWLSGVRADMEGLGYEVGAADLCAAGVASPHIRQRLYWMAHPKRNGRRAGATSESRRQGGATFTHDGSAIGGVVLTNGAGRHSRQSSSPPAGHGSPTQPTSNAGRMEHANGAEKERFRSFSVSVEPKQKAGRCSHANAWERFEIVRCSDGKSRRFEPGSFPLAHGVSGRVGLLRGYGNAIVPQVAAEFILACEEAITA